MVALKKAHNELFRRTSDECFATFQDLYRYCFDTSENSRTLWEPSKQMFLTHDMTVCCNEGDELQLNDWSFSQLCRHAGVAKDTINRLSSETASRVLEETLPNQEKPLQILATDDTTRSIHGVAYTRLWNVELLDVVNEFASDFSPPQTADNDHGTGLYCGEQDMFAFLIDPTGWVEINGQAFAPGFFVWNSEVGRRNASRGSGLVFGVQLMPPGSNNVQRRTSTNFLPSLSAPPGDRASRLPGGAAMRSCDDNEYQRIRKRILAKRLTNVTSRRDVKSVTCLFHLVSTKRTDAKRCAVE